MNETLLFIFMLIGLVNGLLIGFFLLLKKKSPLSLRWVALATILFCLTKVKEFLFVFGARMNVRTSIEDFFQFTFLIPPLLLYSVKGMTDPPGRLNYWLLTPGFVLLFIILPLLVLRVIPQNGWLNAYLPIIVDTITFLWLISIYIKYKKEVRVKLEVYLPLYMFTIIFGMLFISRIAQIIFMNLHEWGVADKYQWWFYFRLILTSVLVYLLSIALVFVFFKRKKILAGSTKIYDLLDEVILRQLEDDEFYLKNDITLEHVAVRYGVSSKALSIAIKHYKGIGYNDYMNNLRIDYFVRALDSEKLRSMTIYGLAEAAGFKSKATFIRAFKKRFKSTPSEYIKKHI